MFVVDMSFGTRLEEERQRLGLNKGEMAQAGNVSASAYGNYLRGERIPDLAALAAWTEAGADPLYIAIGQRIPTLLSPEEEMVLGGYRKLDARGRTGVLALITGMQPLAKHNIENNFAGKVKVGSVIQGDYHQDQPLTLHMGGSKKKRAKREE